MLTARKITLAILTVAFAALLAALVYTAFFAKSDANAHSGAHFVMVERNENAA